MSTRAGRIDRWRRVRSRTIAAATLPLVALLLLSICTQRASAVFIPEVIYVATHGDDREGDGTKDRPFRTIAHGLSVATTDQAVEVGEGSYEETIALKSGVEVRAAERGAAAIVGNGTEPVVSAVGVDGTAKIEGFQITGGGGGAGGGIYCYGASPTISGNTIAGNTATSGGGIDCDTFSNALISGNLIDGNSAGAGGAVYCNFNQPAITGNTIVANTAASGGAVYCVLSQPNVVNNVIAGNSASSDGGAIRGGFAGSPSMINNTITGNIAPAGGGVYTDAAAAVTNCILWNNGDDLAGCTATYSDIEDGDAGTGNISVNPMFVDAAGGDYRLAARSPCIDTATSSGAPATDRDGVARPKDGNHDGGAQVDMGAYEFIYAGPVTLHVSTSGSDTAGDGSLANPFATIGRGLGLASRDDTVQVGAGTYNEDISLKTGVVVQGAGSAETTIHGTGTGSVVTAGGIGAGAKIDGFTITGGSAFRGGGIYCGGCSPTISNNTITGNVAHEGNVPGVGLLGGNGAGICSESGSPAILDNVISGNLASGVGTPDDWGGGVACASFGGIISGNTITNNVADWGGGLIVRGSGSWTVSGNTISDNDASMGAGVGLMSVAGTLSGNVITDNDATWQGGGIHADGCASTIVNNVISANQSSRRGAGIYVYDSTCMIADNSVVDNVAGSGAGGIERDEYSSGTPAIFNCVIWGNGDDLYNCAATYSDISSQDDTAGAGNISDDPKFVNTAGGDYRLRADSPCIDEATGTGAPATDKDGVARPQDGDADGVFAPDLGAHECPYMAIDVGALYATSTAVTVTSRFDGAGVVRFRNDSGTWSPWVSCGDSKPATLSAMDGTRKIDAEYTYASGKTLVLSDTIVLDRAAPAAWVTAPTYCFSGSTPPRFTVFWSGTDSISGVGSYDVKWKRETTTTWSSLKTETTATSGSVDASVGATYYFTVRARDRAGNFGVWSSAKSTGVPYDQTSARFSIGWYTARSSVYYRGSSRFSSRRGRYVRMSFRSARSVALIITRRRTGGYAYVYIGRRLIGRISCYSRSTRYRVPVWIRSSSAPTSGTLKVVVAGRRPRGSRGYRVELDGIAIRR